MKVKFRDIKTECTQIVEQYRKVRKDDRAFPDFFIHTLNADASQWKIHLYRKKHGGEPYISKGGIHYNSIGELAFIFETLGNAWERTAK